LPEPAVPQIALRDIDALLPYAYNARTHSPAQVDAIARSLLEWGWTNAVLADGEGVIAGHGRIMAAGELYRRGETIRFPGGAPIPPGKVPVIDCSGWNPAQRRAYILADNQLAAMAGWDLDLLKHEVDALGAEGFDLGMAGFDENTLAELFDGVVEPPAHQADPDEAPPAPDEPVSRSGDVWVCGPHRVMCGSSLLPADWATLMAGESADVAWTDPPYNVSYEGGTKDRLTIKNDAMPDAAFRQFLLDAYGCMFTVLKAGAPIYVAHADTEGLNFRDTFRQAGFKLSGCLIWRKQSLVLGRSDYQWMHEPILYGWKPGAAHRWYGGRKRTTIIEYGEGGPVTRLEDGRWAIRAGDNLLIVSGDATLEEQPGSVLYHERPSRNAEHPTMKPVGLVEKMLGASARRGDIVIDAFGGSGSTLIAADRLGMSARLMELDPVYVDVIVRRWEMFTGRRAVHAVSGALFPRAVAVEHQIHGNASK
jgi:DNA modification methylase